MRSVKSNLPGLRDINVDDSLDEKWAVKHFLGKDPIAAQTLFRENFLHYSGDLMFVGPRAFCFYVQAAIAYLAFADVAVSRYIDGCP